MRFVLSVVWFLVAACGSLFAGKEQPPGIVGLREYEPYELVKLSVEGLKPKSKVIWKVYPASVSRADTAPDRLQFIGVPGVYTVSCWVFVFSGEEPDVLDLEVKVTIKAPPAPPAPPGPQAPPAPPAPPGPQVPHNPPEQAIGKISFQGAFCTACPILPARPDGRYYLATAAHCLERVGQEGVFTTKTGESYRVRVVALDAARDAAILVTVNPVAGRLLALALAQTSPPVGTAIWHAGYGVDRPTNKETGKVTGLPSTNSRALLACTLNVSSGDSGGPIIHGATGEIVGVVCCTARKGASAPMYAGSVESLRALLARVQTDKVEGEVSTGSMAVAIDPVDIPILVGEVQE